MEWTIYILQCADNTFYTGITNDMDRRFTQHTQGTGAKYTKGRGPLKLLYTEPSASRSEASKREHMIKALSREEKMALINSAR